MIARGARLPFGLLLSLAWTCCAAQQPESVRIQSRTVRQGVAYITYPVVLGPKGKTLNPVIQHWIGGDCDSGGDGSIPSIPFETYPGVKYPGLKDCLASLANYCATPASGSNALDSTCEDSITAGADMNSDGFLVIELTHSSHANMEPHANWVLEYLNLDIDHGRILGLTDLLSDHYEPGLDLMLLRALRKQWSVPAGKTLTQYGMLTNDPGIPPQFAIRPNGLLFTYQVGDVGPDAFGNMTVLIPYSELSTLIQRKGPLARLIGRGPAQGSGGNAGASSPSKGSRQASIFSS